jgi:nucleoside-diphosphate-sugar epimerase
MNAGKKVRGVVRDKVKAAAWEKAGVELVVADINDANALSEAFCGCEGVFVLVPPSFDPLPDFPEARAIGATLKLALEASRPGRVVYLSTIGAEIAVVFAKLMGKPVRAEIVARESWESLFKSQGMKNPMPRIRMLDGFNEGWIEFEGKPAEGMRGSIALQDVIRDLIASD